MRRYAPQKVLTPLPSPSIGPLPTTGELKPWSDGIRLHSLKQASEILTAEFGGGYSVMQLRRRITGGLLGEAGAIWSYDGFYKINIAAFLEWRKANPDERKLKKQLEVG